MLVKNKPISDLFSVICPYEGFFLTKTGGLLAAIELSGVDADTLTSDDLRAVSYMTAAINSALPNDISITQYFSHVDNSRVSIKDRSDPLYQTLSKNRENALNHKGVSKTRLIHVLSFEDKTGYNKTLIKLLGAAILDPNAIKIFLKKLKNSDALFVREGELRERASQLKKAVEDYRVKWSKLVDAKILTVDQFWTFMKFISTQDPKYLAEDFVSKAPEDDCDIALPAGEISTVRLNENDCLRIEGSTTRYCRVASLTKQPKNAIGLWTQGATPLIKLRGNYTFITHFAPLSAPEVSSKFKKARDGLARDTLDLYKMFTGEEVKRGEERLKVRNAIEELDRAEAYEESFGLGLTMLMISSESKRQLIKDCGKFDSELTLRGAFPTWEGPILPEAYEVAQPGGQSKSMRLNVSTASRAGTMGLVYKSVSGKHRVQELNGEEPGYIFETHSGEPFNFTPYHGDRAVIIGVGPTRSGKTFFKNTLTTHFGKYGGLSRIIDVDPGTETLAEFLGPERAGVFRVGEDDSVSGLNPFISSFGNREGDVDGGFVAHVSGLAMLLLEANDTEDARSINFDEQKMLDQAVERVMKLPFEMRNFESFFNHLPQDFSIKFSRWKQGGRYDGIFNAKHDGIGELNKSLAVFNLQHFLNDPKVLHPLISEIFYRITREFTSPKNLHLPKMMEIDEAHNALAIKQCREYIVSSSRKWAKYKAGMSLWSQSPLEYMKTDGWSAIKSAATTFVFMADGKMVDEQYRTGFDLNQGQIDAIRKLKPRGEALIVQPEQNISKVVVLNAEPEQYVINTSSANEVVIRQNLIKQYGVEEGLRRAVDEISLMKQNFAEAAE
ncbi:hypothetical protein WH95_19590 [Kiloniella litopenaei]|uniref:TraG P-loop domain-containing protein n=1 Tax=Kiloniella litopenaei TaxID=1549748 RepID=A0A0M2R473_9PROT|nr:hypothetical protein [Kiloniella litopenaei]KKJ75224.1 hypothetical protein WH95_19590 [Kiloniella litopenaei]